MAQRIRETGKATCTSACMSDGPRKATTVFSLSVALLLTRGEDNHVLIDTLQSFRRLPPGLYDARLVKKVALPRKYTRGALVGCDAWDEA